MTPLLTGLFLGDLGAPELLIILAVITLMFGASKLPELARGSGQALRIFKEETKRLTSEEPAAVTPVAMTPAVTPVAVTPSVAPVVPDVVSPVVARPGSDAGPLSG